MSRSVLIGGVLLAGVVVAWAIVSVRPERGAVEAGPTAKPAPVVEPSEREPSTLAIPAEPEAAPPVAHSTRRTAPLDERPTISGWVVAPMRPGDEVQLVAEVYSGPVNRRGNRQKLRAPVAADGSFALRVPVGTRYALLDLEGRFLYLPEAIKALPGETDVRLRPDVLAVVEGRILPPLGVSMPAGAITWDDVGLRWSVPSARREIVDRAETLEDGLGVVELTEEHEEWDADPIGGKPREDGSFEYTGAPAGVELELEVTNPFGPRVVQRLEPLAAGELRKIVVALDTGMTISGRVIDEYGQPVAGVDVHVEAASDARSGSSSAHVSSSDEETDSDGTFELAALERKDWVVVASGSDLARGTEATVDASGDVHGLVLSVVRGGCIEGTVVWPDGRAAEDLWVIAYGESGGGDYAESGRFQVCGLMPGRYRVEARATGEGVEGKALALDVPVGETALRLVLEQTTVFPVRGTVVDAGGMPVPSPSVQAKRRPDRRSESVEGSSDGSFVFRGLPPGEWTVEVRAAGFQSAEQPVVVGARTPSLHFVLAPAGVVSGRVVDPRGDPVRGAQVDDSDVGIPRVETDADGRFRIEARSLALSLQAEKEGFAPSEVVELAFRPGESVEGVVLRLREACRVLGRVVDENGDAAPEAWVSVGSSVASAQTDARGAFELDGLPPGPARIEAFEQGEGGWRRARAEVELLPGAPSSVELRFEKPDPVRLRGRVIRDGRPLECFIAVTSRTSAAWGASGSDGRFELQLLRPGACQVVLWNGEDLDPETGDMRRLELSVPDVEEHEVEIDFDSLARVSSMEELDF